MDGDRPQRKGTEELLGHVVGGHRVLERQEELVGADRGGGLPRVVHAGGAGHLDDVAVVETPTERIDG